MLNPALLAQKLTFRSVKLPTNSATVWITDLKQDRQGYIWMATFSGLHRYNGYEWSSFFRKPKDPNSDENGLESVCPTRDGLVWIGTQALGLDCLNPESGQVRHYFLANRRKPNKAENYITVLYEGRDGILWIGTHNGLYSHNPKTGRFTHFPHNPKDAQSLSHNQVRSICEDRSGAIWIGTGEPTLTTPSDGGLNKLDRRTGRFTRYHHDPDDPNSLSDNRVRTILEDSRGTLWVGTWGDGLQTMDRKTGKFTRYPSNPAHPEQLSRPYLKNHKGEASWGISFIKEDLLGNIWIGAYAGGLNRYDYKTNQLTHYEAPQDGIENNQWSMCVSRDGVLWFGSASGKLTKGMPDPERIPFFSTTSTLSVNAFYEYARGKILLGTYAGVKDYQPGKKLEASLLQQAAKQTTLLTDRIQSVYEDRQGSCWIGTLNAGLYRYTPRSGRFTNYFRDSSRLNSPGAMTTYIGGTLEAFTEQLARANAIMSTYEDRTGTFWVMTGHGLARMDRQTGQITAYRHNPGDRTTISRGITVCALEDHTGQFWVGTSTGINRMNRQQGTFTHFLTGEYIAQLREDAAGTLWVVSSQNNLFRFDRRQNRFIPFRDPTTGMPLINVNSVVEDDAQNLWVGTVTGLIRINRKRDSLCLFGPNYGFRGYSSIILASAYKSRDSTLFFGGENGYYRFRPAQLMAMRPTPPPLVLSALLVANQPIVPLGEAIAQTKTIQLTHNQNTFAFDFVALDHRHTEQTQYACFLEHFEPTWRAINSERRGSYYNVPPGEYVFRVKAGSSDAGWTQKAIRVVISPPWWRTWWAYLLFTLLAGGAVWGLIEYRSQALRQANRQLEEKVTQRTDELQKSLTELKVTQNQLIQSAKMASLGELTAGIAHEIQNPLNFVNNFSEVSSELIGELREEEAKVSPDSEFIKELLDDLTQNLAKITHHGGRASSIVKGMLEHSRSSTGERQLTDLNGLSEEYFRIAYQGQVAKGKAVNVQLKTNFDPDLTQVAVVPQEIGRVLLNLLNNAFHAVSEKEKQHLPNYEPIVSVSTKRKDEGIEIRVGDNGTGMPESVKAKVFQPFFTTKPTGEGTGLGLSLSYDIVTKGHNGTLMLESQAGEGTEFILTLPA